MGIRTVSLFLLAVAMPLFALNLRDAVVVAPPGSVAATVLVEEMERRSGLRLRMAARLPDQGVAIELEAGREALRSEGYRVRMAGQVLRVDGADARGVLYGVGRLLRELDWGKGKLAVMDGLDVSSAPEKRIRGHQLGFRETANAWDAWTVAQYEQYIRELALFGMNSFEGILYADEKEFPLARVPKREMNRAITQICKRYGMDYWVWAPVVFSPRDAVAAGRMLDEVSKVSGDSAVLTGIFVPGGDPGNLDPDELLPFLGEIAKRARVAHPAAKVWLSMQGYGAAKQEKVYRWMGKGAPEWFGGIVAGPSSPPEAETRRRMPAGLGLRLYPDVSHNKLSQFKVKDWDQAFALTLGREGVNPRPMEYAETHRRVAGPSDGAITYSDGVHDDVNKVIWAALDWDSRQGARDIVVEYCRLHFSPALAEEMADAILALEKNWQGPVTGNGGIEATLRWWKDLDGRMGELAGNWRWQMLMMRAHYDALVRRRYLEEAKLEEEANGWMVRAGEIGAEAAMRGAEAALGRAVGAPELRGRIVELCARLWDLIRFQSSVPKYGAQTPERGAILDFVDLPLNNRWWLEDEFAKVRKLGGEGERVVRLRELGMWERPGPGSFYDDLGNVGKMPRAVRGEGEPLFWWWDGGKSRARHSWQVTMWPRMMVYEGLDPEGTYVVRTTGAGRDLLRMDGGRVAPVLDGKGVGEFKEYRVPASCLVDGRLELTWDKAADEADLNWRVQSRLAEVWVLRR